MAVSVVSAQTITITETLPTNTGSAADASRRVVHDQYNESRTLNAGTVPPATLCASFLLTLVAGAKSIDFRALEGTNGAVVDGNGLKVQEFRIKNLGANNMTLVPGAANGLDLLGPGFSVTVFPGGVAHFFLNDNSPDIAAADKTVDVSGTDAQTAEVTVVMG
jgi:hypothetical protein